MSFKVTYTYTKSDNSTYDWPNKDLLWPDALPWPTTPEQLLLGVEALRGYDIQLQTVYSDDGMSVSNILQFPDSISYGYFINQLWKNPNFNDIMFWIESNKLIMKVSISE